MNYKDYNDYEVLYMIREDSDIIDLIIQKYEPLIKKIAFSFFSSYKYMNIDYDDLVQEGRIALYNATKSYNASKDVLFYTYAISSIKKTMLKILKNLSSNKNKANVNNFNLDYCYDVSNGDIENIEIMLDEEFYQGIINFKNSLPDLEGQIFELRFNGFSYKDINILLDIPLKMVDNKMLKIRKLLREYLVGY